MKLFVRDLTVIDSSYLCERRGMVGESWLVDIEMSGELNEMSMLLDFGRVKKLIKSIIDEEVDHKLLVPAECPLVHVHALDNDESTVDLLRPGRSIHLRCPTQAFAFIPAPQVDKESVTRYLLAVLAKRLPGNIKDLSLTLRQEKIEGAFYHYSHGLKKHDGNCQRIAHGHRSPVEIEVDGVRDEELELNWAERWADIYLGTQEDKVALSELAYGGTPPGLQDRGPPGPVPARDAGRRGGDDRHRHHHRAAGPLHRPRGEKAGGGEIRQDCRL